VENYLVYLSSLIGTNQRSAGKAAAPAGTFLKHNASTAPATGMDASNLDDPGSSDPELSMARASATPDPTNVGPAINEPVYPGVNVAAIVGSTVSTVGSSLADIGQIMLLSKTGEAAAKVLSYFAIGFEVAGLISSLIGVCTQATDPYLQAVQDLSNQLAGLSKQLSASTNQIIAQIASRQLSPAYGQVLNQRSNLQNAAAASSRSGMTVDDQAVIQGIVNNRMGLASATVYLTYLLGLDQTRISWPCSMAA
jgi:hypothetical protein